MKAGACGVSPRVDERGQPLRALRVHQRVDQHEQRAARCRQAELAKRNQWLPIDPPYADATIGGILATNSSGPRRFGYGTIRDHLLGTRSVGAAPKAG